MKKIELNLSYINFRILIVIFLLLFSSTVKKEKKELGDKIELIKYKTFYDGTKIENSIRKLMYLEIEHKQFFIKNKIAHMRRVKNEFSRTLEVPIEDIFSVDINDNLQSFDIDQEYTDYFNTDGGTTLRKLQTKDMENIKIINRTYYDVKDPNETSLIIKKEGSAIRKMYLNKDNNTVYMMYPFYKDNKLTKIYGVSLNLTKTLEKIADSSKSLYKEAYYIEESNFVVADIYTPILSMRKKGRETPSSEIIKYNISKFDDDSYKIIYRINYILIFIVSLIWATIYSMMINYSFIKIFDYIVESSQRYRESIFDPLLGILNRRGFYEIMDNKFEISALGILDIDNFKNINDTYGHSVGDLVLINVANVIKKSLNNFQKTDGESEEHYSKEKFCIRWGGEEILIGIKLINSEDYLQFLCNLRKEIEALSFENYRDLKVTVSIGATTKKIDSIKAFNDAFEIVDANLYKAKKTGKNKIILS